MALILSATLSDSTTTLRSVLSLVSRSAVEDAVLGSRGDDVRELEAPRGEQCHRVEGAGPRGGGRGRRHGEHLGRALDVDPPALGRHALLDPLERGGRLGGPPEQALTLLHGIQLPDHCGGE